MSNFTPRDWLAAIGLAAFLLLMSAALVVGLTVVAAIGDALP